MSLMTNATSRHTICRIVAFPSGKGRMKEQEIKSNLKINCTFLYNYVRVYFLMRTILSSSLNSFRHKEQIFLFCGCSILSVWRLLWLICWSTQHTWSGFTQKEPIIRSGLDIDMSQQKLSAAHPFEPTNLFDSHLFVVCLRCFLKVYLWRFWMNPCYPNIWGLNIMYTWYFTCSCPRWSIHVLMFSDKIWA